MFVREDTPAGSIDRRLSRRSNSTSAVNLEKDSEGRSTSSFEAMSDGTQRKWSSLLNARMTLTDQHTHR